MKLFFTIDALSLSGDRAWRLQDDMKSWRASTYAETVQDSDARVTDKKEAETWIGRRLKKDRQRGLIAKERAGRFDFLMRGIFTHAVIHRLSTAPLPDKKQMLTEMASLKPGIAWLLYLNVAGQFTSLESANHKIIGNLDIAVRGEIASSEHYIGPKVAEDSIMMNTLYHQFLGGWHEHLITSQMAMFIPDAEKLKEESFYIEAIKNWQPEKVSDSTLP